MLRLGLNEVHHQVKAAVGDGDEAGREARLGSGGGRVTCVMKLVKLSRERERVGLQRKTTSAANGDPQTADCMIKAHLRQLHTVANIFSHPALPLSPGPAGIRSALKIAGHDYNAK